MADSIAVQKLLAILKDSSISTGEDLLELSKSVYPTEEVELGRLNWSPRENWVDQNGSLPKYIEDVAIGIMKGSGMPRERAIPIAISRIKKWAAGLDNIKADTQAKAIKALAEWEALKAKAAAKRLKRHV